jgi:flagellar biosynthesis/type III secretory pathway chaperone
MNRGGFNISASIPQVMPKDERKIFYEACSKLGVSIIKAQNEESRIKQIQQEKFDVIIVGNVVQLNYLTIDKTIASSTIYEMIALEKPVIVNRFFRLKLSHKLFRNRLFKKQLSKEMNDDIFNFCFEIEQAKDLLKTLEKAFENNKNRLDVVRDYQRKMLYQLDGKASERVRDAIIDRLEKNIN